MKFLSLEVLSVEKDTPSSVILTLNTAAHGSDFQFKPGQYLTFKMILNGEELRRSYSICSGPRETNLRVGVKKMDNGTASVYLNEELKAGDVLQSLPPLGHFVPELDATNRKHYMLFAGGSGITPMLAIMGAILKTELQSRITLFYANSTPESVMFKDEIQDMASHNPSLKVVNLYTDGSLNAPLLSGRIDFDRTMDLVKAYGPGSTPKEFFICGPGGMIQSTKNALLEMGFDKHLIHHEYFTDEAVPEAKPVVVDAHEDHGPVDADISVELDGANHHFDLNSEGRTILDKALNIGLDAPFSCKGGVCTTCRAKLLDGAVKMDANYALTDEELEEGYILTCQSHPVTEKVHLTWDI